MKDQKQEVGDTSKSDISSTDNKNNSKDNFAIIANDSNYPYNSPQTKNEVAEVKNQEQDNTQQVKKDKNNQIGENYPLLNNLRDFIRCGKFEKIKPIVDELSIKQYKEIVKAHADNSNWNLFHYAAERGNLEILNLLYSKLANNSEQDLIYNLLKEKDEFGKTPYNVAQDNNKDKFCKILLSLIGEDETLKKEIINEAIMRQPNHYKPSEKLVEGLEKRIREEIENNTDHIPHFKDLKHAIEWDCNKLAKEILKGLENKNQEDKKYFIGKHGDCGWNILHFVASSGNIEILNRLCEFEMESMKELSLERNEDNKTFHELALDERHNDFYNQSKALGLVPYNSIES